MILIKMLVLYQLRLILTILLKAFTILIDFILLVCISTIIFFWIGEMFQPWQVPLLKTVCERQAAAHRFQVLQEVELFLCFPYLNFALVVDIVGCFELLSFGNLFILVVFVELAEFVGSVEKNFEQTFPLVVIVGFHLDFTILP